MSVQEMKNQGLDRYQIAEIVKNGINSIYINNFKQDK